MENLNDLYPIQECKFEVTDEMVTILYHRKKISFIERKFFKKLADKPHKVDLDEKGTFIWHLCNGKYTVGEIIKKAHEHFGSDVEPAEKRVHLFMKELNKNRFIKFYEKRTVNQ